VHTALLTLKESFEGEMTGDNVEARCPDHSMDADDCLTTASMLAQALRASCPACSCMLMVALFDVSKVTP
jgi:hypothetical protein